MPLFTIENDKQTLNYVKPGTFADFGILERQHIQVMFRDHPDALEAVVGEPLLVISEEYNDWDRSDSNRRIDLLALDVNANLVVIEFKRVSEGEHMELQALRYAAMIAPLNFAGVVKAYRAFLSRESIRSKHPDLLPEMAESELLRFLDETAPERVVISSMPRIVLMAPSFSKEITTTVLWLNDRGLSVQCIELQPYKIGEQLLLNAEKILPLESSDGYIISPGINKAAEAEKTAGSRLPNVVPYLAKQGVLVPGTRLRLIRDVRPNLCVPDSQKGATFVGGIRARWDEDGQEYSVSRLCYEVCQRNGGKLGSGTFAGPDYWAIEGEDQTLTQRMQNIYNDQIAEPG